MPAANGGIRKRRSWQEAVQTFLLANLTRTGCHWRCLPHDLPPWSLVHYYLRHRKRHGVWAEANTRLLGRLRLKLGRNELPSAAIIDSQTVETTEKGGRAARTVTRS